METIKNEILQIIKAFNLGTFQGSRTLNTNFVNQYTETEFWTEQGAFKHYFKNQKKMKVLTQAQINKKYKNIYIEFLCNYDYSTGKYFYEVQKTSKVIKENMTLGQDVGTNLEYTR